MPRLPTVQTYIKWLIVYKKWSYNLKRYLVFTDIMPYLQCLSLRQVLIFQPVIFDFQVIRLCNLVYNYYFPSTIDCSMRVCFDDSILKYGSGFRSCIYPFLIQQSSVFQLNEN